MTWPKSLTDMELYHWLALAGGALALLALVLAVALRNRPAVRVPASVAATLAGFAAGVGVGVILLTYFGYHWSKQDQPPTSPGEAPQGGPTAMQLGMGGGPPGGGGG